MDPSREQHINNQLDDGSLKLSWSLVNQSGKKEKSFKFVMGFGANAVLQCTEGIPAMQKHPPCAPELSESPQHHLQSKAAAPSEALTPGGRWCSTWQTQTAAALCFGARGHPNLLHRGCG